jgi:DNA-binding winged helix-turn-helix (wHTH) protein
VSIPPKAFDVLRYLVENPVRLVAQDELLEKLWPETYVNPEAIRKYILDIRKILGDRPDKPEFIETVTKRGYRFIATVTDDSARHESASATQAEPPPQTAPAKLTEWRQRLRTHYFQLIVIIPMLAVVAVAATAGHFWFTPKKATLPPSTANSIAVLPIRGHEPRQRSGILFRRALRTIDSRTRQSIRPKGSWQILGISVQGQERGFTQRGTSARRSQCS